MPSSLSHATSHAPYLHGHAALTHLGVIQAQGEEAAKFLHNQLTQDFLLIKPDEARLAGYCSPKGRLMASFIGWMPDAQTVLLVCNSDILPATLKRLSMFVMRSKLRLTDATAQFTLTGLVGDATLSVAENAIPVCRKQVIGSSTAIGLAPTASQARLMLVTPADAALPTLAGSPLTTDQWLWTEVQSGVAPISQPIVEAFVPQMLNYESVGGVNFKKGCYPGQEVVARSQFRGSLKRRAYIVHGTEPMQAGQEVFASDKAEEATGTIALAAPHPAGGWDAIVSMQTASADPAHHTSLHLASANGPALNVQGLPYPLLDDI